MPDDRDEEIEIPRTLPPAAIADAHEALVHHVVRSWVWGKGPPDPREINPRLDRRIVAKFVRLELDDLPAARYWRVRVVADIYHLVELAPFLQSLMNRGEASPAELERSIVSTIMLEETGSGEHRAFAQRYYEHLVAHEAANQRLEELIHCLGVLGPYASPHSLRRRMEQEMRRLEARAATDPESGVEQRSIGDLLENEFFFIEEANRSRGRLRAITSDDERLRELIRVYLGLTEDTGAPYLDLWTQRTICRAAEVDPPAVIRGFRDAARSVSSLGKEDRIFCQVRCYNAVLYFGGSLEPDESALLNQHGGDQKDPLSLAPIHLPLAEEEEEEEEEQEE